MPLSFNWFEKETFHSTTGLSLAKDKWSVHFFLVQSREWSRMKREGEGLEIFGFFSHLFSSTNTHRLNDCVQHAKTPVE